MWCVTAAYILTYLSFDCKVFPLCWVDVNKWNYVNAMYQVLHYFYVWYLINCINIFTPIVVIFVCIVCCFSPTDQSEITLLGNRSHSDSDFNLFYSRQPNRVEILFIKSFTSEGGGGAAWLPLFTNKIREIIFSDPDQCVLALYPLNVFLHVWTVLHLLGPELLLSVLTLRSLFCTSKFRD